MEKPPPEATDQNRYRDEREQKSVKNRQPEAIKLSRRATDLRNGDPTQNCHTEWRGRDDKKERQQNKLYTWHSKRQRIKLYVWHGKFP
jgi:hypothetical protein